MTLVTPFFLIENLSEECRPIGTPAFCASPMSARLHLSLRRSTKDIAAACGIGKLGSSEKGAWHPPSSTHTVVRSSAEVSQASSEKGFLVVLQGEGRIIRVTLSRLNFEFCQERCMEK